jgi:hypothetical protein
MINNFNYFNVAMDSDTSEKNKTHLIFFLFLEQVAYILLYMLAAEGNIGSPYEVLFSLRCLLLHHDV